MSRQRIGAGKRDARKKKRSSRSPLVASVAGRAPRVEIRPALILASDRAKIRIAERAAEKVKPGRKAFRSESALSTGLDLREGVNEARIDAVA